MADEKESAPRARPFTPPLPPFRGPATASRPRASSLTPPEAKRGSLFVGTRVPTKVAAPVAPDVISISALAPAVEVSSPREMTATLEAPPALEPPADTVAWMPPSSETLPVHVAPVTAPESPRADVIAASEAMPWLFTDPGASQPVGGDSAEHQPAAIADAASAHDPSPRDVEPTLFERPHADSRAVTPRSQPAIDAAPWAALPPTPRLDAAAVLESIAARIRGGQIDASDADAASGEATVLVTVLAALLRQQGR